MNGRPLPPAGPLADWPEITTAKARALLESALNGLTLGRIDVEVRDRMPGSHRPLDPTVTTAVVASWLRRSFEAGLAAGRAELVDETQAVQAAQAHVDRSRSDAETYGRVIDEIVTAAAEAEPATEDDTADTRAALAGLLVRIERAAGLLTANSCAAHSRPWFLRSKKGPGW